ncbi:class I SAM-dependent methyltransferase [bacterium]|nr:class I SAM-dependent methyltransferase [bacterium]
MKSTESQTESHDYLKWEERYSRPGRKRHVPDSLLLENWHRLEGPRILDVACGEGRNSLFLASKGFQVTGIDRSPTAIAKARQWASEASLNPDFICWDLDSLSLPGAPYDSIVVTRYWQPSLCPVLTEALRPGGVLLYETYTIEFLRYRPQSSGNYLLQPGELPKFFTDMEIMHSAEVDKPQTREYCAQLIARKIQGISAQIANVTQL